MKTCDTCAFQRHLTRYAVPTCEKAKHPHGGDAQQACVIAWERCEGRHWRAK